MVQPMVTGGRELIIGGRQDPQFGPVIMVGLGGVFVEVFGEAVVRVAPITHVEAVEMVESLRGVQILKGARGHKPADIESVVLALTRLSQLMTDFPAIKELDVNPLRVFHEGGGVRALDARIILE
jgi:4-hydroxybutyryl-CoA synthetase (ADP-forming)